MDIKVSAQLGRQNSMSKEEKELITWPIQNPSFLEEVFGIQKNKKRDLLILEGLAEGITQTKLSEEFNLSQERISVIAINNKVLLDKLTFTTQFATKAGRIRLACRCLQGRTSSEKDTIEILDYLRKEVEGDAQLKLQINQLINVSDEDLNRIIEKELQAVKDVKGEVAK